MQPWHQALEEKIRKCRKCPLHATRHNPVVGEGSLKAEVMFIGEAPGRWEDIRGRPFVGQAGKLLDSLLGEAGLTREEVYITNVVKCRPPNNRDPGKSEIEACRPYLDEQITRIKPGIIVCLGRHSLKEVFRKAGLKPPRITDARGRPVSTRVLGIPVTVLPTLHPAAALYNPNVKSLLEEDFKLLRTILESPD